MTPPEAFLASRGGMGRRAVARHFARREVPLRRARVDIRCEIEPGNPVHEGVTVFDRVRLHFELEGVNLELGERLVTRFKGR